MSSIGSTLNSINQSLLAEINTYSANKTSQAKATSQAAASSAATSDRIDFSQVGQLFQDLEQLQTSDPAEFKQVLTDAAAKFEAAAQQQTDPNQAAFLNDLAGKFQKSADSGNLSAFAPQ